MVERRRRRKRRFWGIGGDERLFCLINAPDLAFEQVDFAILSNSANVDLGTGR